MPSKVNKNKQQDKRINRLEKMIPVTREVILFQKASGLLTSGQFSDAINPYPSALNSEKVSVHQINCKTLLQYSATTQDRGASSRVVLLLYKCDVDYSGASPAVTEPTSAQVFHDPTDLLTYVNPDNRNRIKILRDSQRAVNGDDVQLPYWNQRKAYKKPLMMMPTVDKAFVWRPFIFIYQITYATGTPPTALANTSVEILTSQLAS